MDNYSFVGMLVIVGVPSLIAMYKFVEGHFEKKHNKEIAEINKNHEFQKKNIEENIKLRNSIDNLSEKFATFSEDMKELKKEQQDIITDYYSLEDKVEANSRDIEAIKKTVFVKDYTTP